jgi:hypothetical protein
MSMIARLPPKAWDRPHGEILRAAGGLERHDAVQRQAVAFAELGRQDDRVGLGQEHQRVVEHRVVAGGEIVLTKTPIAGHVDAQDQETALARQAGPDDRLDDGRGHADLIQRLDPLEDLFREPGVAGGDLEFGGAGNAVDGLLEAGKHGVVGRVHRHEDGNADHDRRQREQRANDVLSDIRPAHEPEQHHRRRSFPVRSGRSPACRGDVGSLPRHCNRRLTARAPSRVI